MRKLKKYTIEFNKYRECNIQYRGNLHELIDYFNDLLEEGKLYENERYNRKITTNPKSIRSLIINLNNSKNNASRNGHTNDNYHLI